MSKIKTFIPAVWIVNASPFIGLAKIGRLELLTGSGRTILLPETVVREIMAGPQNDPAVRALDPNYLTHLGIQTLPTTVPDPHLSGFTLDAGEVAVLTEALIRPDSVAVIDDGPGRAAGKALGITLRGSIGVLVLAQRQGRIPALTPELHRLQEAGLYLPREDSLRELLASLGEGWP